MTVVSRSFHDIGTKKVISQHIFNIQWRKYQSYDKVGKSLLKALNVILVLGLVGVRGLFVHSRGFI